MFNNVKVGDKVWNCSLGWGIVNRIKKESRYGLIVKFDYNNSYQRFMFNGLFSEKYLYPTLFWEEQKLDYNTKRQIEID